jgi:hypothetical protein
MASHLFSKILVRLRQETKAPSICTQEQREALLDLLVWTMFVDRHIAAPEQAQIEREARGLPWEGYNPVELFLDASVRRIRDALGSASAEEAYLCDIATRLGDGEARQRAFRAAQEMAGIDGNLAEKELEFLERVRASLGLPEPPRQP